MLREIQQKHHVNRTGQAAMVREIETMFATGEDPEDFRKHETLKNCHQRDTESKNL